MPSCDSVFNIVLLLLQLNPDFVQSLLFLDSCFDFLIPPSCCLSVSCSCLPSATGFLQGVLKAALKVCQVCSTFSDVRLIVSSLSLIVCLNWSCTSLFWSFCLLTMSGSFFYEWMNEWMMHLYSTLLCIVVHPKHFTIMCVCVCVCGGGGLSTWMMRRLPQDNGASALTTHQLQVERRESLRANQVDIPIPGCYFTLGDIRCNDWPVICI